MSVHVGNLHLGSLLVTVSSTMLRPSLNWYLIGPGPMVPCGQIANLGLVFKCSWVPVVCKLPYFPWESWYAEATEVSCRLVIAVPWHLGTT